MTFPQSFATTDGAPDPTLPQCVHSSTEAPPTSSASANKHQLLDALCAIAYMTGSPLQRQQFQQGDRRSNSRALVDDSGAIAAVVDLLSSGIDAERLVAIIEHR